MPLNRHMYDMYQCKIIPLTSPGIRIIQDMTFFSEVHVRGIAVEKAKEHREVCIFPVNPRFTSNNGDAL